MNQHMPLSLVPTSHCGTRNRILVVDDDPTQTLWSRHYLEEAGFEVDEASDGARAIASANSDLPDLVVLDVMLPDTDGFQVCQALKKDASTRDISVLLATGLDDTCSIEKGFEVGATDFMPKPFSWVLLVNRIKYLLRNDRLRRKLQEMSDEQKAINSALAQEIKERSQAERKIREMALHDPLTGLANRKKFHQEFASILAAIGRGYQGVGMMFLDLDRFKQINDTWGHATGDGVLKAVADKLRASTRGTDLIARLGGDEFAIVVTHQQGFKHASGIARRILRELSEPILIDGTRVPVGASIGIMLTTDPEANPDRLMGNADQALYQAKKAGRGQFRFFNQALKRQIRKGEKLGESLDGAWERGEIAIHYQPKIAVADGHMIGAEALLRWNHPDLGLLSPNKFIPVAEASDLITPITFWLIRNVCRQLDEWSDIGLPDCTAAINVSPSTFEAASFFEETRQILDESGINPSRLIFEITEETAIRFPNKFAQLIRKLRELGVRLSIDDFGTGFSSMAYLRNFTVDEIKIDKIFIDRIHECERDLAICKTLIQIGHILSAVVVAEGVTCRAQLEILRKSGCDHAQGFLMAKPMTADEVLNFRFDVE